MAYVYYPDLYFTTASIFKKQHLLKSIEAKQMLLDTFQFLSDQDRVTIFGFAIMSNHFHIIWQINDETPLSKIQHSLLSFTSKELMVLIENSGMILDDFLVRKSDRMHQIWNDRPLSIPLTYDKIIQQKLNYTHSNPVAAKLVTLPEKYFFSSCRSYIENKPQWPFLTLWRSANLL